MEKIFLKVNEDIIDKTLAYDVYTDEGLLIIPSDTLITNYIFTKIREFKIDRVYVYKSPAIHGNDYFNFENINDEQKKYIDNVNTAKLMIQDLASGKGLDINKAEHISNNIYSKINDIGSLMECVNSVKIADQYTYSHSINVSVYGMLIGKWMGLDEKQLSEIIIAGLLHDVGKSQIPVEILNKKGKLTCEEYEIVKRHTIFGFDIIKKFDDISMEIKRAVIMHHEKEDGTGYPFGIGGKQKNLYSKIITAADIFDAITSERIYKGRQTPFIAFKELEKIGYDVIDPKVMLAMFSNMPSYYIGSKVKMENGEIGEVVYVPNQCVYAPVIKVNNCFHDFAVEKELYIKEFL
jgi:putative nucleotidyltransferase with HDIG domain